MKKRIFVFLCTALMATLLMTGCSISKEAITADDFTKIMKENGYSVDDVTDDYSDQQFTTTLMAEKDGEMVGFIVVDSGSVAEQVFSAYKYKIESIESSVNSNASMNGKNYSTYSRTTSESYYYTAKVDETLIYIEAEKDYKDDVKDIVKKLGY